MVEVLAQGVVDRIFDGPGHEPDVAVGKEHPLSPGLLGPAVEGMVLAQPTVGQAVYPQRL